VARESLWRAVAAAAGLARPAFAVTGTGTGTGTGAGTAMNLILACYPNQVIACPCDRVQASGVPSSASTFRRAPSGGAGSVG
jgi:hypothetical protein